MLFTMKVPTITKYGTLGGAVYNSEDFEPGFYENLKTSGLATPYTDDESLIEKDVDLSVEIQKLNTQVTGKASKEEVESVATQLAEKAKQTDLIATNQAVAEKATQLALNATNNNLVLKAEKVYVDDQISKKLDGSPKGVYATLSALQTAFPTGTTGVYVVQADGKLYGWLNSAWTAIRDYQTTLATADNVNLASNSFASKNVKTALEEAKNSVNKDIRGLFKAGKNIKTISGAISKFDVPLDAISNSVLDFEVSNSGTIANVINLQGYKNRGKNLFNKAAVVTGKYIDHTNGTEKTATSQTASTFTGIDSGSDITFSSALGLRYPRMVFYDVNNVFLSGFVGGVITPAFTQKPPANAAIVRVSADTTTSTPDTWQIEIGSTPSEYAEFQGSVTEFFAQPIVLKGVQNLTKDALDSSGVLTRRLGESNFNGTEVWYEGTHGTDAYAFYLTGWPAINNALTGTANSGVATSADGNYPIGTSNGNIRGINLGTNLTLFVEKTKVDLQTGATPLDKFKAYLTSYPINFIYKLKTETKEQLNFAFPKVYAGGKFELISDVVPSVTMNIPVKEEVSKTVIKNEDLQLEKASYIHKGGNFYTAFGSGVMVAEKEIHAFRCGKQHTTVNGEFGSVVAYIKDKYGNWTTKILNLGIANAEIRDVNLSLPFDGTNDVILSGAVYNGTVYTNWMFRLDKDLNLKSSEEIVTTNRWFTWGNYLNSPNGVGMKAGYDPTLSSSGRGISLLRKTNPVSNVYDESVTLFPASSGIPTEVTMGYWGNKLIAICRQNNGFSLYRETLDLEGATGWSEPRILPFKAHAPSLQPYTPKGEPLILTMSTVTDSLVSQSTRLHRDISISATYDGVNWHSEKILVENNHYGGYNSFVPNGFNTFGMVYHDDYDSAQPNYKKGTDVYYKMVQLEQALPELSYLKYKHSLGA